mgnify:CR=1 FL=1
MDLQLLLALVLGIATIIVLVLRTRLDAFVALLIAALVTGLVAGQPVLDIVSAITTGFGNTLASIGIVIGLGVAIGKILEVSGAANALALAFLRVFGHGREPWAMGSVGALVSIPVFCDSGYVIMNPLARSIARVKRAGYVTLALALGCGMTLTHHLVPPTPGPLAVAGILGADIGAIILVGLAFTVLLLPVVVFYAKWIGPQLEPKIEEHVREAVYGTVATAGVGGSSFLAAAMALDFAAVSVNLSGCSDRDEALERLRVAPQRFFGDLHDSRASDPRGGPREVPVHELPVQPQRLEDLRAAVTLQRRDAHLREDLQQAAADRTDVVLQDRRLVDRSAERLLAVLPDARLKVVGGGQHNFPQTHADRVGRLLQEHLA